MKQFFQTIILSGLIIITSCSPTTKLVSSWSPEKAQEKKYNKVGVMVLTPNTPSRLTGEEELVKNFTKKKVNSVSTFDMFPLAGKLKETMDTSTASEKMREEMKQKVKNAEIDAIMIVSLFDKVKEERYVQGSSVGVGVSGYYPGGYYGNNYYGNVMPYAGYGYAGQGYAGYYGYSVGHLYDPGYYTEDVIYFIEFTLYDVKTEKLLWAGQTKTVNFSSAEKEIKKMASLVVNEIMLKKVLVPSLN